jgi:RNA polymerase sigma-70 factor, ECF subfamily
MEDALRSLSAEHRDALLRVHFHGESLAEFGGREHLSEVAVKARLHDALHALRDALAERGVLRS